MRKRYISRFRMREMERNAQRRIRIFIRRRMRFNALFKWMNSKTATKIYPEESNGNKN